MSPVEGAFKFTYSIDKITGEPTERHFRRKGDLLTVLHLKEGHSMLIQYKDGSGTLRTSRVEEILEDEDLIIETLNTYYRFDRVE